MPMMAVTTMPPGSLPGMMILAMTPITNPDTRLLVAKARAAGVDVDYHEGADLIHVYPLLPTPEGKQARQTIIRKLGR